MDSSSEGKTFPVHDFLLSVDGFLFFMQFMELPVFLDFLVRGIIMLSGNNDSGSIVQ